MNYELIVDGVGASKLPKDFVNEVFSSQYGKTLNTKDMTKACGLLRDW